MQVVIDIPDDDYYDVLQYVEIKENTEFENLMIAAIKNGTPLPKGHGDLIDRRELLKLPIDKANYPSNYVKYAPIIIRADRSESEE